MRNNSLTLKEVPSRQAPVEEDTWLTSGHGVPKAQPEEEALGQQGQDEGRDGVRVEGKLPDCSRKSWPFSGPPWSPWNKAVPSRQPWGQASLLLSCIQEGTYFSPQTNHLPSKSF